MCEQRLTESVDFSRSNTVEQSSFSHTVVSDHSVPVVALKLQVGRFEQLLAGIGKNDVSVYVCMCVLVYVCMYAYIVCVNVMRVYVCLRMCVCTYTHTHTHTHVFCSLSQS
jgi:hypothetical protein